MRTYLFKNPWWMSKIYRDAIYTIPDAEGIFLTFDDGPDEVATPWVLDLLERYHARATFFLVGNKSQRYPHLVEQLVEKGHSIGGHTHRHVSGWKLSNEQYLNDVEEGFGAIPETRLFRPPYGRIRPQQLAQMSSKGYRTVMWSHLSGDFDRSVQIERSVAAMKSAQHGSILLFHDSQGAFEKLTMILPRVLEHFSNLRYSFKAIPQP